MLKRPCSRCGVPSRSNPCGNCRDKAPSRPSRPKRPRQDRGYGAEYERFRSDLIAQVKIYGARCYRCGGTIAPDQKITADHIAGKDRPDLLAPACASCNFRAGGRTRRRRP